MTRKAAIKLEYSTSTHTYCIWTMYEKLTRTSQERNLRIPALYEIVFCSFLFKAFRRMAGAVDCRCVPEHTEWFIEDQAFLRSFDSAPRPPLPPSLIGQHYSASCLFFILPMCRRPSLLRERGVGGRCGDKSYDREKAWPSIKHSILSGASRAN